MLDSSYGGNSMAKITALIHTCNDGRRIARALESLRACDELLVIDHGSSDDSVRAARRHGATVKEAVPGVDRGVYAVDARHDWILCLLANEAASEAMEATLFEWKEAYPDDAPDSAGFAFALRQESESGWQSLPPETRLVNRRQLRWEGGLPPNSPQSTLLEGAILRFHQP